jgi:hypothetical protein
MVAVFRGQEFYAKVGNRNSRKLRFGAFGTPPGFMLANYGASPCRLLVNMGKLN